MTKTKMNNLFVKGRRAAAIALLSALPFTQAKAYDERAYMTSGEQSEYQANGTLPNDIENKKDNNGAGALVALCIFAGAMWVVTGAVAKKTPKDEIMKNKKSFTL